MITYRRLCESEINRTLFCDFIRRQVVTNAGVRKTGNGS